MKITEIKALLKTGALNQYTDLYANVEEQTERFLAALDSFALLYGEDRDVSIFSVPG